MRSVFFRVTTDGRREAVGLEGHYAGALPTACWVIGGGPSLGGMPCERIAASPVAKMGINLAGTGRLRPTFWTAYDRTCRFLPSVYLDASVTKILPVRRVKDLVPGTTLKVCECPNTVFFERDGRPGFADLLDPARRGVVDWADSMVMALEIVYRLGFRRVFLVGCEMRVRPTREQLAAAQRVGVEYDGVGLLQDFVARCEGVGLTAEQLDGLGPARQYHFAEYKPTKAAAQTDLHYFRVSQYLRLSRRNLAAAGLQIVSVTPGSRLNDYFPYQPVHEALAEIARGISTPREEDACGLYRELVDRRPSGMGPMRDLRPLNWRTNSAECEARNAERGAGLEVVRERDGGTEGLSKERRLLQALAEARRRRGVE